VVVTASWLLVGGYVVRSHGIVSRSAAPAPSLSTVAPGTMAPSPPTTPSPTPSMVADVRPDPTDTVRASLAGFLSSRGAHAGIAVLDRVTGRSVAYNGGVRFATASVVKVDILATLLWECQRAGRTLTVSEKQLATAMMTRSDNDAASDLWEEVGGANGVAQANRAFGLTQTSPNRTGYWGLSTTTAADQLRLLTVLATPGGPLSAASRAYELGLMGRVEADQRWGVPRAAAAGATAVYVKNGWLANAADRSRWITNSVGRIVEPGHDWLVAVLADHNESQGSGISVVERLAVTAVSGLRPAPSG
jgi:beta-lactamase class A